MNKTFKFCALVCAAILLIVSCSPVAEVSDRSFEDIDSGKYDFSYNNLRTDSSKYIPFFDEDDGNARGNLDVKTALSSANFLASDTYVTIWFPKAADVLRTEGDMTSALQGFLSFNKYTAVSITADEGTASAIGSSVGYKFVRRNTSGYSNGVEVTVTLESVPESLVMIIKGADYKVGGGYTLYVDNENSGGYNDIYQSFKQVKKLDPADTTGKTEIDADIESFTAPGNIGWEVIISKPSSNTFDNETLPADLTVTEVAARLNGSIYTDKIRDKVLKDLEGKFQLQKFNLSAGSWDNASATFAYKAPPNDPTGTKNIYYSYKMEDKAIYRIIVTGVKDYKTADTYYGVKQKIKFGGTYDQDTVVGSAASFYNSDLHIENTGSSISVVDQASDDQGRNVVLYVSVPVDILNEGTDKEKVIQLKTMDTASFNKAFKIAFVKGKTFNIDSEKISYIDIDSVEYLKDPSDLSLVEARRKALDYIKITLAKSYKLDQEEKVFLISPDFTFSDPAYYFGDYNNYYYNIDGVRFWKSFKADF